MNVSEYLVNFLQKKEIEHVFGYPGGMVTHLMEAFSHNDKIETHLLYHEQAVAFAACAYSQVTGKVGVAYATSGPGATNLITGIANAYFDSIPVLFITGQVNTKESKGNLPVRQKGFQELDIVSMVKDITKYAVKIDSIMDAEKEIEKAYKIALLGRKGPVLIDIPIDISCKEFFPKFKSEDEMILSTNLCQLSLIEKKIMRSSRIVFLLGAGARDGDTSELIQKIALEWGIPIVCSMISIDLIPTANEQKIGFIGAYGARSANIILENCDLIIAIGSRLDVRQTGSSIDTFAKKSSIIRVEIDENELANKIKNDELAVGMNSLAFVNWLTKVNYIKKPLWIQKCIELKKLLSEMDKDDISEFIDKISTQVPMDSIVTTDVGQNQVWIAQHFNVKKNQRILFSGGLGSMGYSLPASIGAYYGSKKSILSVNGDGGFMMNMQELLHISENKLPITILVFNNRSLGMIRHFQEMYFSSNYFQTTSESGFHALNYEILAKTFNLDYERKTLADLNSFVISNTSKIIEVMIDKDTYISPKLKFGDSLDNQEPYIDDELRMKIKDIMSKSNE